MGTLKESKLSKSTEGKEYSLTDFEMNFFKALVINRNAAFNQYQAAIQGFLTYLAGTKWAYKHPEDYDFEVDSEKQSVKVTLKKES